MTFQVDLSVQIAGGVFDPDNGFVEVRGVFNEWGGGDVLMPVEGQDAIYALAVRITTSLPGSEVRYKYVINGGTWESGDDRLFTLAAEDQTLPVRTFDDLMSGDLLAEETFVVFRVNMADATPFPSGAAFDPDLNSVFINGDFLPGGWIDWANPPSDLELFDDGVVEQGEAVAGDGIYSLR